MSHATADLEYFKCDLCGVYLHKDIFCDHRRDCKGPNSVELKKSECKALERQVDLETRRLIAAREASAVGGSSSSSGAADALACGPNRAGTSPSSSSTSEPSFPNHCLPGSRDRGAANGTSVLLSTAQLEKRAQDAVRRRVADAYQTEKEEDLVRRLRSEEQRRKLLDFLES